MTVKSQMNGRSGRNEKVGVVRTTQGRDRTSGEGWSKGSLDVSYDMTETRICDESRAKRVLDTYNYTEEKGRVTEDKVEGHMTLSITQG